MGEVDASVGGNAGEAGGVGVGVDEGVEAVGLSGFVIEVVVVVGLPIWCWWVMGLF